MAILPTLVLVGLAFQGVAPGSARDGARTSEEWFAAGVSLHQTGDILGAIDAYRTALELEPTRVDARSNLGAAYARLGRYTDAVEQYRKVLDGDPTQGAVRFNLALALYKSDELAQAAEEFEAVLKDDPGRVQALLLLADCQLRLGQDARVVALLAPHEGRLGEDRLFSYLLGTALLNRKELERGQALIDRLFRGGETAEGHFLLGVAHLQRSDGKSALTEFRRAIELNAKLPTLRSFYGRALLATGQREEAAEAFRAELENNLTDFEANLYRGLLLKDENRLDEAQDHLRRAARSRPQDPRVQYGLGSLALAAGRIEEARKALEQVTSKVPDYQQAHVLLATVYYRQKKKDLGDRERAIADKLKQERQADEPGAQPDLGPIYRGEDATNASRPAREEPKAPVVDPGGRR